MEIITSNEQLFSRENNTNMIYAEQSYFSMLNSQIEFQGKNNRIYCLCKKEETIQLKDSQITIKGDNNIIVISASKYPISISCTLGHGCSVFIGKNFWSANCLNIMANELSNVYIGEWCLCARDVWILTSDMHLIFDIKTKKRINYNKDVYIGKHVWIGQDACLLKGAVVGSGSIIGMRSVCSNKKTTNVNASYAGTPARMLNTNIMWRHKGSNQITVDEVMEGTYDIWDNEKYIYKQEEMDRKYAEYEKVMYRNPNMEEKIEFLLNQS